MTEMISASLPVISVLYGVLLVVLYIGFALRAVRSGVRIGHSGNDPRQQRTHAPLLFWGTLVLSGFIMVRSGVKFIEYGLVRILVS